MCTRQPRKVIWDMINTLFLTTVAVVLTFVVFQWHLRTYVRGLSCHSFKFLWRTGQTKPPTIPFGIVACTFSDNLSRNSCIHRNIRSPKFAGRYVPRATKIQTFTTREPYGNHLARNKYIEIHFESSLNLHFLFFCFVFRDIYFIRLI